MCHQSSSVIKTKNATQENERLCVCVVTAGFCARSKHQNSKAVSFAHPNKTRIDHPPVCPRSSTKERGGGISVRDPKRGAFSSLVSVCCCCGDFRKSKAQAPFLPCVRAVFPNSWKGKRDEEKKLRCAIAPGSKCPYPAELIQLRKSKREGFKTGKKKTRQETIGHTFRFGLGVEDGWSRKCGPKNDAFFLVCCRRSSTRPGRRGSSEKLP
jgi:hypothetical protein